MDEFARTVEKGSFIGIFPDHKFGFSENLENTCTHKQLNNKDFFIQVPSNSDDESVTVTVVVTGKQPYLKSTYKLPYEIAAGKVYDLTEYLKQLECTDGKLTPSQ